MLKKHAHCSYCGHAFQENQPWPRTCASCANVSYLNPLPVSVVLLPVDDGLLLVRREIEPRKGLLALPGGYIDIGESWQQAGAREVLEETGISIDPNQIREFRVRSAPDGTVLIFGLAAPIPSSDLPAFQATNESSERVVLREPAELAFSLHTEVVQEFFAQRRQHSIV